MLNRKLVLIYRTGGKENFRWHRSLPSDSRDLAQAAYIALRRAGYEVMIADYERSIAVGLPETFDANTPLEVR